MSTIRFPDRTQAGRLLAERLGHYEGDPRVVVLGLPRGGVPVAHQVATTLGAPLDVFLVRKLGVPGHEELAMGAIASGSVRILNDEVVRELGIGEGAIAAVAAQEENELQRRERLYRGDRPSPDLEGRIVILVDDGLATGSSMRAAVAAVRSHAPERIVVAVPAAARSTCADFEAEVDEVICLATPEPFFAVGEWYDDFSQTTDDEVKALLAGAREHPKQSA